MKSSKPKKKKTKKKRSLVTLCLVVGSLIWAAIYVVGYPNRSLSDESTIKSAIKLSGMTVTIAPGTSFSGVTKKLLEKRVIRSAFRFRMYAKFRGDSSLIKPGQYSINRTTTPSQLMDQLIRGVAQKVQRITIPEGLNMLEVFDLFHTAKLADRDILAKLARSRNFLQQQGISAMTAEGYLFPDTYQIKIETDAQAMARGILQKLIKQHRLVWQQEADKNRSSFTTWSEKLQWTDHNFLIMASIVEKEAVAKKEQPTIAKVFYNRLLSPKFVPHRLETDPTIRYGCSVPQKKSRACQKWDPKGRLRRAQLDDVDNLYNTYRHEGLPPGPICNPGRGAIAAAMRPDDSDYFFFVSRNDGTHVFSRSYKDHNKAVNRFQR